MSLLVDSTETFGAGPHVVLAGGVERVGIENAFPGLAGRRVLTLREDARQIRQRGILVASDSSALAAIAAAIDALVQDAEHTLTDAFGATYGHCVLMKWGPTGPRRGPVEVGGASCVSQPYEAEWLQTSTV